MLSLILLLNPQVLAQCASQCNAYAKALHYVEKDFRAGDLQGVNNYDYSKNKQQTTVNTF